MDSKVAFNKVPWNFSRLTCPNLWSVCSMPANVLAPSGVRRSAGTMITQFWSRIHTVPALQGLTCVSQLSPTYTHHFTYQNFDNVFIDDIQGVSKISNVNMACYGTPIKYQWELYRLYSGSFIWYIQPVILFIFFQMSLTLNDSVPLRW